MSKIDYKEYLASREWALKRKEVRERSKGFCERCGVGPQQAVHHKTYANVGHEPLEDLQAICNACHEFESGESDFDPFKDLTFVVIAVSKTRTSFNWIDDMPADCARFVGKMEHIGFCRVDKMQANPHGDDWVPEAYWSAQKAPRCLAVTKAGKPCPNPAKRGTARCVKHLGAKEGA